MGKKAVEEEIYAMAYAYGKMNGDNKKQSKVAEINKKILEMKKKIKKKLAITFIDYFFTISIDIVTHY